MAKGCTFESNTGYNGGVFNVMSDKTGATFDIPATAKITS